MFLLDLISKDSIVT
jgi:hypothetical protein